MDTNIHNDELTHWGIKGMRWGIRRYQNKDGSLTAAGQKRYDADMKKTEAKIKKLETKRKNQQATKDQAEKLKAAKAHLKELKKGKTKEGEDVKVETDEQKRSRILTKPTAKDVIENRHLFSNKEIGDLWTRLNNEQNISKLIPDEEALRRAKTNQMFDRLENAAGNINKAAKLYNTIANVYNAFGNSKVSLPKIDLDNTKGNREVRRQEKKRLRDEQEKADAAKRAEEAAKKAQREADKKAKEEARAEAKRAEEMRKYKKYNRPWTDESIPYRNRYRGERTVVDTHKAPDNASTSESRVRRLLGGSTSRQTVENTTTALAIYSSPISSISRSSVSTGRRYVSDTNRLSDGIIDLYEDETGRFSMR